MRLLELKNKAKVVVVYGGGFQPFHQGHMSSYLQAKQKFPGADFYVAASNDTKTRPIPFDAKQFLAQQAGVVDPFVQVSQPINPREILANYNPEQDILVLVRSERDPMSYTKKDGTPGYYQPFVSVDQCEPFSKHGYILVTKKHVFDVNGEEVYSGSQVRTMYAEADNAGKANIIKQLYPKARDQKRIKQVFDQYLSQQGVAEGLNEFAMSGSDDDEDDKYTPQDFGKPFKANYLGQNKFEVFCRKPQDPSNVIKLNAEVQKYGLEWEENFGFWFLDSPGAVYLSWKYGEIPLPKAIDQARNPGHIHDLVTDYLTNSPHAAEIQKIATEYFGFTMDGDMNKGLNEFAPGNGGGDDGQEDMLLKFARMWYNGDLRTQKQVEQTLARAGWEIGELESEEGGAFVVQSGDEHGDSYIGFAVADLTEDVEAQFDIIEEWVEQLAKQHGVDAEVIWEDFEVVNDHDLLNEAAAWRRKEGKNKNGGLNAKGVASYRRENPGSKLQTAVTTKPSKLKKGSKAAKRRKSFCARMGGMKGPMKKPNGKPTRKALALRKWNC